MLVPIITIDSPSSEVLRGTAEEVTKFGKHLTQIVGDMKLALLLNKGLGIAAPQVNYPYRIIVLDSGKVIINPKILSTSENKIESKEMCLSVPGKEIVIERFEHITLRYQDKYGKWDTGYFYGLYSRVVQHELDHLDGKLIIDYEKP